MPTTTASPRKARPKVAPRKKGPSAAKQPNPTAAPRKPHSFAQKMWLSFIMIIGPVALISAPGILVSKYFGQQPTFSKKISAEEAEHQAEAERRSIALRQLLVKTAQGVMPDQFRLAPELAITADSSEANRTITSFKELVRKWNGSAVEQPEQNGRHTLLVQIPQGSVIRFVQDVETNMDGVKRIGDFPSMPDLEPEASEEPTTNPSQLQNLVATIGAESTDLSR